MGRIILVYGVIAGVTVAILMRIAMMLFPEGGTGGMVAAEALEHLGCIAPHPARRIGIAAGDAAALVLQHDHA